MWGVAPTRRGSFALLADEGRNACGVDRLFCFGKRTQNHGRPGAALRVPLPRSRKVWAAELASLKQSSPPYRIRDRGAAAPAGALRWRHGMARVGM